MLSFKSISVEPTDTAQETIEVYVPEKPLKKKKASVKKSIDKKKKKTRKTTVPKSLASLPKRADSDPGLEQPASPPYAPTSPAYQPLSKPSSPVHYGEFDELPRRAQSTAPDKDAIPNGLEDLGFQLEDVDFDIICSETINFDL